MKKYILIFVAIFSFLFFSDRVEALSYEKCGNSYEVTDELSLYYYCYYSHLPENNNYSNYVLLKFDTNSYRCVNRASSNLIAWGNSSAQFGGLSTSDNSIFGYISFSNDFSIINDYSSNTTTNFKPSSGGGILYSNVNIIQNNTNNIYFSSNIDLENYFRCDKYTITYYLNNQVYQEIEVQSGGSHTLLDYTPEENYNWSGWQYDSNIDFNNITSNVEIRGTSSPKPIYTITYSLNNSKYYETSVVEGHSHTLISEPDYNKYTHSFSGWQYDSNIDFSNIISDITITGTLTELQKTPVYIDFPISKNDFYALLVLVANLNIFIFLKWCFPFKMGGDLK